MKGMRKATIEEKKKCPKCGRMDGQVKNGRNRSGTQTCLCKHCKKSYTLEPKRHAYSKETRTLALKIYYAGVSGRGVGKVLGMSKANVYNWIKKTNLNVNNSFEILELDELYWFIFRRPRTETRENVYLMTMVSREPRQIVGFDVAYDKSPERIQKIVDAAPTAKKYCTDGFLGYIAVVYPGKHERYIAVLYPGKHERNIHDKSDTYTVEGVNADLRHYIPVLARRSRCFARKLETLKAVAAVFAEAYNRFGLAKSKYRQTPQKGELPFSVLDFL